MNQQLIRLGFFATVGIVILVGFSFYVNDEPFWYRPCNKVDITVDDATGLRRKSPVKTLGLDIGYIKAVDLDGTNVVISVCVTAPVRLRGDTKAYVRSIGFLGDRFLELKPVDILRRLDNEVPQEIKKVPTAPSTNKEDAPPTDTGALNRVNKAISALSEFIMPSAYAAADETSSVSTVSSASTEPPPSNRRQPKTLTASREVEISDTMKKVSKLVDQLTLLVQDVRGATSQVEFKDLIVNLNDATKNLAELLDPKSELTDNLRKSMESLRKSLKNAEEMMAKVNDGKGTLGKLVNDDKLYDEAVAAVRGINTLLGRAGTLRVFIDMSADSIPDYKGGRANLLLQIEPNPTRYYLLGIGTDSIGAPTETITTTSTDGGPTSTQDQTVNQVNGIKWTAALGKFFGPLELKAGLINSAGTVGIGYWLDEERRYGAVVDIYKASSHDPWRERITLRAQVFMSLYLRAGVDDIKRYQTSTGNEIPFFFGAGIFFNDEDIKYLLAFK